MIQKANFHTHCLYCDGKNTPEEMVQSAIRKGFTALGFSSHGYAEPDKECDMPLSRAEDYRREILALREKYRGQLRIFCGIEQDFYGESDPKEFEYCIGSVHLVKKDGRFISVDHSRGRQEEAVEALYGGDWMAFAEDYFDTVGRLCEAFTPNLIGHFDLITKFNEGEDGYLLFDETAPRYLDAAEKALRKLVPHHVPFEINTGAIARGYRKTPYPGPALLEMIRDMGGTFVYSSDCHNADFLDCGWEQVLKLAEEYRLELTDFPLPEANL